MKIHRITNLFFNYYRNVLQMIKRFKKERNRGGIKRGVPLLFKMEQLKGVSSSEWAKALEVGLYGSIWHNLHYNLQEKNQSNRNAWNLYYNANYVTYRGKRKQGKDSGFLWAKNWVLLARQLLEKQYIYHSNTFFKIKICEMFWDRTVRIWAIVKKNA